MGASQTRLVRPSKREFISDVSSEDWIQFWIRRPASETSSSDTPQTNHLLRCLLSAILSRNSCTRYYHDTLSRNTCMKYTARSSQKYFVTATNARQTHATLATECMIRNANKRVSVVALARFRCRFCTKSLLSILLRRPCKSFAIDMNLPCNL